MPNSIPGQWAISESDVNEDLRHFRGDAHAARSVSLFEASDFDTEDPHYQSLPDDLQDEIRRESRKRQDEFRRTHGDRIR